MFSFLFFSKFLVYSSLFLCSLLVGLKLDNLLPWSYWIVFTPLWIWKIIVLAGASVGTIMWVRHPEYRYVCAEYHFIL